MFYDRFVYLCKQRGVSPSRAAVDAGISKSLVTKWKTNKIQDPSADIARKLATYFGMTVSEVLGDEQTKEKTPAQISLSEGEQMLIDLFRQVPADKQALVLQMIRAALETK